MKLHMKLSKSVAQDNELKCWIKYMALSSTGTRFIRLLHVWCTGTYMSLTPLKKCYSPTPTLDTYTSSVCLIFYAIQECPQSWKDVILGGYLAILIKLKHKNLITSECCICTAVQHQYIECVLWHMIYV